METSYTTQLALSMLLFAPGLVLFVGLAFVGVLVALEKTVFRGQKEVNLTVEVQQGENPAPGAIVNALKTSSQGAARKTGTK